MKEIIQLMLERMKVGLIANQQELGIRSSGASAASLSGQSTEVSGELTGSHYFYQQIHGRKPGKFPPPDNIRDWIENKGIRPRDEKTTINQLVYLFSRKIAEAGTDIFKGLRPALAFNAIVDDSLAKFEVEMADFEAKRLADILAKSIAKAYPNSKVS